jgi:hypothetical protein
MQLAHRNWSHYLTVIAAAWIACVLSGCSKKSTGFTEVSGVVTYQGKPLTQGFVTFVPAGDAGSGASGTIGPDGRYELLQSRSVKGIAPGQYKIRIESWEVAPGMGGGKPKHAMPEKYYLVTTSPLQAKIEPGESQTIDLVLED